MIRIFARRPFVFVALFLCLGVYVMVNCLEKDVILFYVITLFIFVVFVVLTILITAVFDKSRFVNVFIKFLAVNKLIILFCFIMYVLGGLLAYNKINYYTTNIDEETYEITAIVDSSEEYYSSKKLYLKNVTIIFDGKEEKLKGITCLTFYENENELSNIEVGDKINFVGNLTSNYPIKNGELDYYSIRDNIRYEAQYISDLEIVENNLLGASDIIHKKVLDTLISQMPIDIAYLSYSILFGDSSYLSDFTNESFKISGVAHIVAVSGMNVVIIVSLLLFIFRFIKIRKLIKFIIINLVLIGYCYLCAFTPSVVRATIMALIVLSARFIGKQGDILSSLGLSCIIICIIWPLSIYDVGFLLSFTSVIGIVFFGNAINNFLHKNCKFPNFLSSSIAMTVSAQIGIYPIMATYFNSFSLYSIPANIVIVPIFSLGYILLFATIVLSLVFPFLAFTLFLPSVVLSFVNWFPSIFINLPYANLYVSELNLLSFVYYVFITFISQFILIKDKIKLPINIILIITLLTLFIIDILPKKYRNTDAIVFDNSISTVLLTSKENDKILVGVGGKYDTNKLTENIQRAKIYSLDAVFIINSNVDMYIQRTNLEALQKVCDIKNIYVEENSKYAFETLKNGVVTIIPNNDIIKINNLNIYPLSVNEVLVAMLFVIDNIEYAFIFDVNMAQAYQLQNMLKNSVNILCYDNEDYLYFNGYPKIIEK